MILISYLGASAHGVETQDADVVDVVDSDTVTVHVGEETWRIRLLYIRPPCLRNPAEKDMPETAKAVEYLKLIIGGRKHVTLWAPGAAYPVQSDGSRSAVIRFETRIPGLFNSPNAMMVEAGFSPYWQSDGTSPDIDLHAELLRNEEFAERHHIGLWESRQVWMSARAQEALPAAERARDQAAKGDSTPVLP